MTSWPATFSLLLLISTLRAASKSKDNPSSGGCTHSSSSISTGSVSWRCGTGDPTFKTDVQCHVGSPYRCKLTRQQKNQPSECDSSRVISRGKEWSYSKKDNKCMRVKNGIFTTVKYCENQCVKKIEQSLCNCTLTGMHSAIVECPERSLFNFTLTYTTQETRLVEGCRRKQTARRENKSTFQELLRECKNSTCKLETVEYIYRELENMTSRNLRGNVRRDLAEQVRYLGEAVHVFKGKYNANFTTVTILATYILRSTDNIMFGLHDNANKRSDLSQQLVSHLESTTPVIIAAMARENQKEREFEFHSQNIDMIVVMATPEDLQRNPKVHFRDSKGMNTGDLALDTSVYSRRAAMNCSSDCAAGIGAVLLKNVSELFPLDVDTKSFTHARGDEGYVRLASSVLSVVAVWNGSSTTNISGTFSLANEKMMPQEVPRCAFWDEDIVSPHHGAWSSRGVRVADSQINQTQCRTSHLTSFAILLQTVEFDLPPAHALALEVITYIGCSVGLICLLASILIFTLTYRGLTALRHRIHLNICIVLAVAQTVFMAGIDATHNKITCTVVAVLLHYLYTAAFSWMCVEGVHLYFMVVHVYNTQTLKIRYYMLFGWGLPAVIVAISLAANMEGYGTKQACWISIKTGLIWAFVIPVIIFNLINIVILVKVMFILVALHESPLSPDEGRRARVAIRGVFTLMPLLGLSWMFGLLCVNKSTIAFQYLFAILNTLQGAFLFGFHCVGNTQVRSSLKRFMDRQWQICNFRLRSRPTKSRSTARTTRGHETHGALVQKNGTTDM